MKKKPLPLGQNSIGFLWRTSLHKVVSMKFLLRGPSLWSAYLTYLCVVPLRGPSVYIVWNFFCVVPLRGPDDTNVIMVGVDNVRTEMKTKIK